MYDLINLGVLRNRLLFRNVSLDRIDELIRHHISRIPQAIANSETRLRASDLEATLAARAFLATGVHIDVGDLDRAVRDMVQKMKADAAEVITVSFTWIWGSRIGGLMLFAESEVYLWPFQSSSVFDHGWVLKV